MSKKIIIGLIIVVLVIVGIALVRMKREVLPPEVGPIEIKKVFFVHSYDPEDICGRPQDNGVIAKMEELGFKEGINLEIKRFYMDTKKIYTAPEQMKIRGEMAIEEIKIWEPDLIMTIDDDAAREVMLPLVGTKYPIVFSGMNAPVEIYDEKVDLMESRSRPGKNVTGVIELLRVAESVKLMQRIIPLKKLLFISDTAPVGKAVRAGFLDELEAYKEKFPSEVELKEVSLFEDYQAIILEANKREDINAIFPIAVSLGTKEEKRVSPKEIAKWTLQNSQKPDIAPTFFFANFGYMAGVTIDFPTLGGQAAVKAVRILKGEKAGDVSIDEAAKYTFIIALNLARAKQLGVLIPSEIIEEAEKTGKVYETMALYPEYKLEE